METRLIDLDGDFYSEEIGVHARIPSRILARAMVSSSSNDDISAFMQVNNRLFGFSPHRVRRILQSGGHHRRGGNGCGPRRSATGASRRSAWSSQRRAPAPAGRADHVAALGDQPAGVEVPQVMQMESSGLPFALRLVGRRRL